MLRGAKIGRLMSTKGSLVMSAEGLRAASQPRAKTGVGSWLPGRAQKERLEDFLPKDVAGTAGLPAERLPGPRNRTPYPDRPRSAAAAKLTPLLVLLALEKTPQIDLADGGGGLLEAFVQLHSAACLLRQPGGNVEGFQLSLLQNRPQELDMQVLGFALGAAAIGLAALAPAFDEGARKHLAKRAQAADQPASQLQFGITGQGISWVAICHPPATAVGKSLRRTEPPSKLRKGYTSADPEIRIQEFRVKGDFL